MARLSNQLIDVNVSSGNIIVDSMPTVSLSGSVGTYSSQNPALSGIFGHTQFALPGVVAANTFMSIYNPVGSGKTLVLGLSMIACNVAGASTIADPMVMYRITAAPTGGSVVSTSTTKYVTASAASVAEVRVGNPTVVLDGVVWASFSDISGAARGADEFLRPNSIGSFTLVPGEGVAFRTAAGNVQQRWNITQVWGEM